MHCPQCGTEVADDRSSCPACGAGLADGAGGGHGGDGQSDGRPGSGQPGGQPGGQSGGGQPESGQLGGGQPGGGQPGSGQPGGGQPTGGAGGQPTQPTRGAGQAGPGGQGGRPQAGGGQGAVQGGQQAVGGGGQQQQQYQQPSGGSGTGLRDFYDAYVADLPIAGGAVAGVLVYVVGFVITAAVAAIVIEASGGSADLEAVSEPFYNAHFTTLTSSDPNYEVFPATLGIAFVAIPYMLFITGSRFGRWHSYEGIELPEQVLAGAAVVVGYLPAVAIGTAFLTPGSDTFPPNYAGVLIIAGLLYPVLCGGFGGLVTYVLDEYASLRARVSGNLTALFVFLLTFGVTYMAVDSSVQEPVPLALATGFSYIAGHLFAVDGDGTLFLVMLVPLVLVAAVGYLRARRSGAEEWVDGLRAGSSFAFGYAPITLIALVVTAVVVDFGGEIATELGVSELPLVVAEVGSQLTLESQLTPPQFLEWFVVVGILYPLVIGGIGGALHVLIQRTISNRAGG